MGILNEILSWSKTIPKWQSHAIAKLIASPNLGDQDLEDLVALLKIEHGIEDPKGRTASPLTDDIIPEITSNNDVVKIKEIKNLCNVNAIASNQILPILLEGVTVIYGDNGSGKSGYSRVLKVACRARDQVEPIHPNANLPPQGIETAQADFTIIHNGEEKTVFWKKGVTSPPELSAIAVFDTRCAKAYLENEADYSYIPFGLEIFESLGKLVKTIKIKLESELADTNPDLSVLSHLKGSTIVGKIISDLSEKTKITDIEKLSTLSQYEIDSLNQIKKSLAETNPKERAGQLQINSQRIQKLIETLEKQEKAMDGERLKQLLKAFNELNNAKNASAVSEIAFEKSGVLLPGTGGEAWRILFEASKQFVQIAYPKKTIGTLTNEDLCPLCQEPLRNGASRLRDFETYLKSKVEETLQSARKSLDNIVSTFHELNLTSAIEDDTLKEVAILEKNTAEKLSNFSKLLTARWKDILSNITNGTWKDITPLNDSPISMLKELKEKLIRDAESFEKAADDVKRGELVLKEAELDSRVELNKVKSIVLTTIKKMIYRENLNKCITSLKTKPITDKSKEISEKVVSKELELALNTEFKALGVSNLKVTLQSRADTGKPLHKLKIDLPRSLNPSQFLSEGEQRAIAISSFLAEVNLSGIKGGLVFDDPVSSLDHRRRELVARRLVNESQKRQIIIFTHDIYFLSVLMEEAASQNLSIQTQSLVRTPLGFGVFDPELPFQGKNTSKRIGALKNQQQYIDKQFRLGDEVNYRKETVDAYVHLRMAWERAVEEILFGSVVTRFKKPIETQKLNRVAVEDNDYKTVSEGMTKCSNYAHDKAIESGTYLPEPSELLEDIETLEKWVTLVNKRSDEVQKRRKQ